MAGHGHGHGAEGGDKRIALLISILALLLALAETGAKSAQTEALSKNVEASNLWAFFQARTVRQTVVGTATDLAELDRAAAASEAAQQTITRQQEIWRDTARRWESEPETGEGRRELAARAHAAEAERDTSFAAYHLYEYGSAIFQVAIVLASASIITAVPLLAVSAAVLGALGMGLSFLAALAPTALHL
jgi:hypothetical protein